MPVIRFEGVVVLCLGAILAGKLFAQDEPPRSTDPRLKIELYAESPQIVTPTGIDVDHSGRVWAIESNTHFPPEGYKGHPTDRILVMEGKDSSGRVEKITVFKDGLTHSMSIAVKPVWLDLAIASENSKPKKAEETTTPKNPATEVFIATRREIFLCTDTDGDLKCDDTKRLVHLETSGNYPHNGLAGFAFDALGNMYFGFGENLGADYKIIGSDQTTLYGGGEGGNIYRCRPDGSKLERWATGFWNPHASCFDAFGNLFTLDNDPDSRPPCRLLHIIQDGDYGYRFRNGRKGTHPFTAWNGEIPGTLPMVSGTGEAPSGIVCYESDGFPEDYMGTLLVGSWGDHRIDKFVLKPRGVSFESIPQPLIKGGENFRPVGLAIAPDGSMYVTDWVSKEYKLHGLGRVWRVSAKEEPKRTIIDAASISVPSTKNELQERLKSRRLDIRRMAARQAVQIGQHSDWCDEISVAVNPADKSGTRQMEELVWVRQQGHGVPKSLQSLPVEQRWKLASELWGNNPDDPFSFSIGLRDFSGGNTTEKWIAEKLDELRTAPSSFPSRQLNELLLGLTGRRNHPTSQAIPKSLVASNEPSSRRLGVQWIGEEHLKALRPEVERVLATEPMSTDLFLACLASLSLLDGVPPAELEKTPPAQYILAMVKDSARSASLRATALRMLAPNQKELDGKLLGEMLASTDQGLRREAVRTLALSPIPERSQLLSGIAADQSADISLRADAVAGLAPVDHHAKLDDATRDLLTNLASSDKSLAIRLEAIRSLRGAAMAKPNDAAHDGKVTESLAKVNSNLVKEPESTRNAVSEALAFASGRRAERPITQILTEFSSPNSPPSASSDSTATSASTESGRRTFFHVNGAGCYKCHTVGGRGGQVGPDLTVIARTMDRKKLAESILEPSKEISPQFTTWAIETVSGKTLTGMLLGEEVNGDLRLGNNQGEIFFVPFKEIETRSPLKTSIMPEKLHETMTSAEFRDLIAFLETLK